MAETIWDTKNRWKCCKTLPSEHKMKLQKIWLPAQDLNKMELSTFHHRCWESKS